MSNSEVFGPRKEHQEWPEAGTEASLPELIPELNGFGSAWTDPPPSGSDDDPLIGATLSGTYRIRRILGEGGMGRVYEAQHTRIQQKLYAIKVLHPEFTRDADVLARFQREAEAAACLSHPASVGVFDVARTPQGWPYLVCEHLTGMDLAELIKARGPLAMTAAQHIALQVCGALVEAHANGVIHRDLKPQNIFVLGKFDQGVPEHPHAKVLDFGLSRILNGPNTANLTRTGVILGTPSYMSPEQARGERADQRTDVYGVGALLYAAVTGSAPFRCETPQATMLAVMNEEPVRPSKLNSKVPARLELVIQRAMARDMNQRYPTMEALRDDLEHAVDPIDWAGDTVAADQGAGPPPRPALGTVHNEVGASRAQLIGLVAAATLLVVLAVVTGVAGLVLLRWQRWPLSRLETTLTALLVIGTLLTPLLLWARKFYRRVWGNTARVVEVLARLRETTVAGLITYGVGAVGVVFFDTVVLEVQARTSDRMWAGTGPLLMLGALMAGAVFFFSSVLRAPGGWVSRAADREASRRRSWLVGPGLKFVASVSLFGLFGVVLLWRWRSGAPSAPELQAASMGTVTPRVVETAAPVSSRPSASNVETEPKALDLDEDLEQEGGVSSSIVSAAVSRGLQEGLLPLLAEHPNDPKVLRATAVAQASSAATLGEAMANLKRLFAVSPQSAEETDLQHIVTQTTRAPAFSAAAFDLLANSMGSTGADVLFKLALAESEQRDVARRYLARPQVHGKFSEALRIAYDLQFAQSCTARVRLLERAKRYGDERSARVLAALARGLKRGCGAKQRQPCKPPCPAQAEQFLQTVDAINDRLKQPN